MMPSSHGLPAYEENPAHSEGIDCNGLRMLGFHMQLTGLTDRTQRYIDIALTLARVISTYPAFVAKGRSRQQRRIF